MQKLHCSAIQLFMQLGQILLDGHDAVDIVVNPDNIRLMPYAASNPKCFTDIPYGDGINKLPVVIDSDSVAPFPLTDPEIRLVCSGIAGIIRDISDNLSSPNLFADDKRELKDLRRAYRGIYKRLLSYFESIGDPWQEI